MFQKSWKPTVSYVNIGGDDISDAKKKCWWKVHETMMRQLSQIKQLLLAPKTFPNTFVVQATEDGAFENANRRWTGTGDEQRVAVNDAHRKHITSQTVELRETGNSELSNRRAAETSQETWGEERSTRASRVCQGTAGVKAGPSQVYELVKYRHASQWHPYNYSNMQNWLRICCHIAEGLSYHHSHLTSCLWKCYW